MNSGGKRQAWLQSIMDACKQRADNAGRLAWTRLEDQCVYVSNSIRKTTAEDNLYIIHCRSDGRVPRFCFFSSLARHGSPGKGWNASIHLISSALFSSPLFFFRQSSRTPLHPSTCALRWSS